MELTYIVLMTFLGLSLIIIEVMIIPGSTVVGFIGFATTVASVYLAYRFHGVVVGASVMVGSGLVSGGFLYYAIQHKSWKLFSLNKEIEGKVSTNVNEQIKVGLEGTALSSLRPYGKAEFDDETFEVVTFGSFVDVGTLIRIVKVENEKIFVEPITT